MNQEEINELEKKYKEYLPMPSAKQILKLIDYARELEEKVNSDVLCPKRAPALLDDD